MNEILRKKSPRAPSISLEQALDGAVRIYEKERRHPAPADAVAQHLGYKSANNGTAVKAMASIRYFGLLDRPAEGMLAVAKDVESYQYAPSPDLRQELLKRWLKTPVIFAELLDNFKDGLPSDPTLRYEFIQRGFLPDAVDAAVTVFRQSVDFARYFESSNKRPTELESQSVNNEAIASVPQKPEAQEPLPEPSPTNDRIPIRLTGGRRAWLEIPAPFYEADKDRIKKQVDLLLTEEDETDLAG
jgi:hypothetical protein